MATRTRIRRIANLAVGVAAVVTLGGATATAATPTTTTDTTLTTGRTNVLLDGAVKQRRHLTTRDLARLPQHTITLTLYDPVA